MGTSSMVGRWRSVTSSCQGNWGWWGHFFSCLCLTNFWEVTDAKSETLLQVQNGCLHADTVSGGSTVSQQERGRCQKGRFPSCRFFRKGNKLEVVFNFFHPPPPAILKKSLVYNSHFCSFQAPCVMPRTHDDRPGAFVVSERGDCVGTPGVGGGPSPQPRRGWGRVQWRRVLCCPWLEPWLGTTHLSPCGAKCGAPGCREDDKWHSESV